MDLSIVLLIFFSGLIVGLAGLWVHYRLKVGSHTHLARTIVEKAEQEVVNLKRVQELALKQSQLEQQRDMEIAWQNERCKLQREEERLEQREDKLENRMHLMEKKLSDIEKREAILVGRKEQLEEEKKQVSTTHAQLIAELEKIGGLTVAEAKELLILRLTNELKGEVAQRIRRAVREAEEEADREARKIVATAIQRLAVSCASEVTVHTVAIPGDEMKGRIIGREGRNIRTLEQETGVNFMIDDAPGVVVLSGHDPIRIQIAKMALTDLVADGRIFPTRIEEVVEKAKENIHQQIRQHGEDAALRAGIINLHPEIITLLGKLKYRLSFGQNVLEHSLEVSHLMGMMAGELGLDPQLAKRIGLLHDMGKAISHEVEGTHALIGRDFALKYGETKEVANGIGCHHGEIDPITIEGSLCSAADAISAARPGARIDALEEYIKRLQRLEEIALEFSGVDRAYAMQAGREIRVVVQPGMIDDAGLILLARDLTKRIEKELNYPGKIKITAIREKRVVEYAV